MNLKLLIKEATPNERTSMSQQDLRTRSRRLSCSVKKRDSMFVPAWESTRPEPNRNCMGNIEEKSEKTGLEYQRKEDLCCGLMIGKWKKCVNNLQIQCQKMIIKSEADTLNSVNYLYVINI